GGPARGAYSPRGERLPRLDRARASSLLALARALEPLQAIIDDPARPPLERARALLRLAELDAGWARRSTEAELRSIGAEQIASGRRVRLQAEASGRWTSYQDASG